MRIYLAASYAQKERMRGYRDELLRRNHIVTSRWIELRDGQGMGPAEIAKDYRRAMNVARMDIDDITVSEILLVFTDVPSTSGGFHFEVGYAMARDKLIALIGPRPSVFFSLPIIGCFRSWESFLGYLDTGTYRP
jgi:nucleoside 2-deoxyribosyltransferase